MPNIMAFKTLDGGGFLDFGVSNANIWPLTHLMKMLLGELIFMQW